MQKFNFSSLTLVCAGLFGTVANAQDTLNVYMWGEYLPDSVISLFEERSGLKVNYSTFDSLEILQTKLLAGQSGYDVVLPAAINASNLIKAGALRKLDMSLLPNHGQVDDWAWNKLATSDPGNQYGVPYLWGTTGYAYNVAMIAERMPDAPLESFDMVFDPAVAAKFADCGIVWIDAPEQVFSAALNYLGYDPYTIDAEQIGAASAMLAKVRPFVKAFNSSNISAGLANGDYCLALTWSGDASLAMFIASESEEDVTITYAIPSEGTDVWIDFASIPIDAPNPEAAHKFLDFIMQPEVIAMVSNEIYYANAVPASLEYVVDDVKGDPSIYPPADVMERLYPNQSRDAKTLRKITRAWTKVKSGL